MSRSILPLCCASLLLGACGSTPKSPELDTYHPELLRKRDNAGIGLYLTDIDASLRAWNQLTLTARDERDRRKAALLEEDLTRRARRRQGEIIEQLETGGPFNRMVAAVALGFTGSEAVLSPLVGALDDPDPNVVANAVLGLAILGLKDTPHEKILELYRSSEQETTRSNAAYALRRLVESGKEADPELLGVARMGLLDPEPTVRAQSAVLLARVVDSDSIERLRLLVFDDVPLASLAAARALAYIGDRDDHSKGTCARALVSTLDEVDPQIRIGVLRVLRALSRANYGQETADWAEWADRLP